MGKVFQNEMDLLGRTKINAESTIRCKHLRWRHLYWEHICRKHLRWERLRWRHFVIIREIELGPQRVDVVSVDKQDHNQLSSR